MVAHNTSWFVVRVSFFVTRLFFIPIYDVIEITNRRLNRDRKITTTAIRHFRLVGPFWRIPRETADVSEAVYQSFTLVLAWLSTIKLLCLLTLKNHGLAGRFGNPRSVDGGYVA